MGFMRRILDEITGQILGTLMLGLVLGIVLTGWAFLLNWGPIAVFIGLGTPILLLHGANQVQTYFEHHPRRLSTDELATTLSDWLIKNGYNVKRQKDPETEFVLVASFEPQGGPEDPQLIVIRRFSDDQPPLLLSASMDFDEVTRKSWANLAQPERVRCFLEAQIDMMRFGLSFIGLGSELGPVTIFKPFPVRIYYGSRIVSEKAFTEEVQLVRRASNLISLTVTRALLGHDETNVSVSSR